jgi:hypothetical protein
MQLNEARKQLKEDLILTLNIPEVNYLGFGIVPKGSNAAYLKLEQVNEGPNGVYKVASYRVVIYLVHQHNIELVLALDNLVDKIISSYGIQGHCFGQMSVKLNGPVVCTDPSGFEEDDVYSKNRTFQIACAFELTVKVPAT